MLRDNVHSHPIFTIKLDSVLAYYIIGTIITFVVSKLLRLKLAGRAQLIIFFFH